MGYEDDPYRDEDGEPLMDYDDMQSDPEPEPHHDDALLDDYEDEGDGGDWRRRERSQTPVYDHDSSKSKPRKRLVKKGDTGRQSVAPELEDEVAEESDDHDGVRNVDDDNFIDDTGVEAGGYYGSDEPRSPGDAPQAEEGEEDDEIKDLFKVGKKKKKNERSPAEIALLVENVMAELEVTAEEDAELNRQGKPAINKLKKLDLLTEVLSKKQLQLEFLDHGVLTLLKNWLEPLPDGSLPNINIRTAILNILNDFPIDLEQYDRREQLKKSGLGKVIMFLSKSDEEINAFGGKGGKDHDGEVKEMWDTIAGGDSEDDHDGVRNVDDDNFIDDTGVEAGGYYGSDEPRSPGDAPQAEEGEEDDEIKDLFKVGKKKKKNERSPAEIALLVENVMAELEVTAEEDAELNRQGKPAINKLKKLDLLTEVLSKKQLQLEFLDHGVLTLLKNWLEPLPDGSLPNINIRTAILTILNDFPIDLEQYDRREQLKKSGLGKVIMFLSKSDEEINVNRKLAKELVDKWSRPIFNKSTRFEDMRNAEDDRIPFRRPTVKKPANKAAGMESRDGDLDLEFSQPRSGQSSSRQHASRPEATPLDFVIRPQSKIDPEEVRARAKAAAQDQQRMKMNKKLQQLRAPKKKQLQATKLSVEGRGMIKYL
ncbi:protein IWS1 homolog 1 [Arachis ipaensis]|uniref:protein IWS1 homolog 1 n=1 Tax=Arachis ipaensis TaxID=130454 RepID=UPI000A2B5A4C|nr:protein IWS1 homolog 1 [Arachis ipaensis]